MRLPVPSQDKNSWGKILNSWLRVTHNDDGTLTDAVKDNITAGLAQEADLVSLTATVEDVDAAVGIVSAEVFDPSTYGAVRGAVSSGQRTTNHTAIQEAATAASSASGTLVIKGLYEVDAGLVFLCHVDGSSGSIVVYEQSIAPVIRVGGNTGSSDRISNKAVRLPLVVQGGKTAGTGWSGTDVGVEIANCYQCHITVPQTKAFKTGVRVSGYSTGCVSNHIFLGILENCKVPLHIEPGNSGGWANQNTYYQGRGTMDSSEGDVVSGSRGLLVGPGSNPVNGNVFIGYSCEGNGWEFHQEIYGSYNLFIGARPEVASVNARFQLNGADAVANEWWGGYDANNITWTYVNSAASNWNKWKTRGGEWIPGSSTNGSLLVWNQTSDTNPAIVGLPATATFATDPSTAFLWTLNGQYLRGKRTGDAFPRIEVNFNTGVIAMDNGVQAPRHTIGPLGSFGMIFSAMVRVGSVASYPAVSSTYRGMAARVEGAASAPDVLATAEKNEADGYVWRQSSDTLVASKTASFTAGAASSVYLCNAASGAITVTLPTSVGAGTRRYTIKKTDATNNVVVDANGSQTIDGALAKTITTQYGFIEIVSDGANWFIIASGGTIT